MSLVRKASFCICENKDADQLRSYCAADQRLYFRYRDSTIPLLPKTEFSMLLTSSVVVTDQVGNPEERGSNHFEYLYVLCIQCLLLYIPYVDEFTFSET